MLVLGVVLLAASCAPQPMPPQANYAVPERLAPLVLSFGLGDEALPPATVAVLQQVARSLPVQTVPELYLSGPLTLSRAHAVRDALARPIVVYPASVLPGSTAPDPNAAVLVLPVPDAILPEACRGVGEPGPAGIWPGDDARRERMLPAGCATAASIAAQVERPADLLAGRPLPPGAASPFADAIERYYRRNQGSQGSSGSSAGGPAVASSGGAQAASAANPLLGALPATSSGSTTQ